MTAACDIRNLTVVFPTKGGGSLVAVKELSLRVARGEAVGVVGESGSGKSTLALALLRLVPPPGTTTGEIFVGSDGAATDVLKLPRNQLTQFRGKRIGLVLQDPASSLNPIRTVEAQLREAAMLTDTGVPISERLNRALTEVELDPGQVLKHFPFELSGGMNQRVTIAMALIQSPELLIADEPTTALDVTTQATILALLNRTRLAHHMAVLLISHDIGVVYQVATRVAVMYAGRLVELGPTDQVLNAPSHPYTQALIAAVPSLHGSARDLKTIPGQLAAAHSSDVGCPFAPRCALAMTICRQQFPPTMALNGEHHAACWALTDERPQLDPR